MSKHNMAVDNPYNYNLPVDPDMFFGRNKDLELLVESLLLARGDSYALIGGRRMGKTSFLEALMRAMSSKLQESEFLIVPVFVDLSGDSINSVRELFQTICDAIFVLIQDKGNINPIVFINNQPPAPYLEQELLQWNRVTIANTNQRLRIVLLIDECEQIIEKSWAPSLYGSLRHLLVSQKTRNILKLVMTGSHRFLSTVRQQGSPLRNILRYHYLKVLETKDLAQLITKPTSDRLPKEVVTLVEELSGGHPFLAQYLLHNIWEKGISTVTKGDVNKIALNFSHIRGDFYDWLETIGILGKDIYEVVCNSLVSVDEVSLRSRFQHFTVTHLLALDALCYHGLVTEVNGGYTIAGTMFRNWFQIYNKSLKDDT